MERPYSLHRFTPATGSLKQLCGRSFRHCQFLPTLYPHYLQNATVLCGILRFSPITPVSLSILNGTVSVTDTSKYLCGELKEGQGVCYYDLAHMEKLPELMRDLLADDARREEIVRAGIPVVEEKHTWIRRAHQLLEWIEEDERGTDRKD